MAGPTSDMAKAAKEGIEARADASGDSIKAIAEREAAHSQARAAAHPANQPGWKAFKRIPRDPGPEEPGWKPFKKKADAVA